jgi:hypothetical protein
MSLIDSQLRKDSAQEKAEYISRDNKKVEYLIQNGDIIIQNGKFAGRCVRELFGIGPEERDYVIKNLWMTNDQQVMNIINELVCK